MTTLTCMHKSHIGHKSQFMKSLLFDLYDYFDLYA